MISVNVNGHVDTNMNIINAIKTAERKKKERNYQYIYWCIDVHGVILTPTYNLTNEGATSYPYCLETLQLLSNYPDHKLILWSSSHNKALQNVSRWLEDQGIDIDFENCNTDYTITDLCDFTEKFYFDILLDDKAGFEAETGWKEIYDYLLASQLPIV